MNLKGVLVGVVLVLFILMAVKLLNRDRSGQNEFSRSLNQAADNIEEGTRDAKRSVQDALD